MAPEAVIEDQNTASIFHAHPSSIAIIMRDDTVESGGMQLYCLLSTKLQLRHPRLLRK